VRRVESAVEEGSADTDADPLYEQVYVDRGELRRRITRMLQREPQVGLSEVLARHPLERGLAELVAYVDIGCSEGVVDESCEEPITISGRDGSRRVVRVPRILFVR
jgi:hypothetical protein